MKENVEMNWLHVRFADARVIRIEVYVCDAGLERLGICAGAGVDCSEDELGGFFDNRL